MISFTDADIQFFRNIRMDGNLHVALLATLDSVNNSITAKAMEEPNEVQLRWYQGASKIIEALKSGVRNDRTITRKRN